MKRSPFLSALTAACFVLPTPAQALVPAPYALGISRLRAGNDSSEARAFDRLEKRLLRTLENTPELGVRVRSISVSDALRSESGRLRRLEGLALRMVTEKSQAESLVSGVEKLVSETTLYPEDAPLIQSTRLAQSVVFWRKASFVEAGRYLDLARRMHPQGALEESVDALLSGEEARSFRLWLTQSQSVPVFECSLDLSIAPIEASVTVNGFEMGARRHFELIGGTRYQIVVTAAGYLPKELGFECKGVGQWIETLHLLPGVEMGSGDLLRIARLAKSPGVGSLVVVDSDRLGRFRLFLYTSGIGLESIPTEQPLTLASLDHQTTEERLPISSDALSGIIESHRRLPLRVGAAPSGEQGYTLVGNKKADDLRPERQWYEKKEFWWILGGVGAAVLTGLVLSRNPGRVGGGLQGGIE
jgi:hypothetical protein